MIANPSLKRASAADASPGLRTQILSARRGGIIYVAPSGLGSYVPHSPRAGARGYNLSPLRGSMRTAFGGLHLFWTRPVIDRPYSQISCKPENRLANAFGEFGESVSPVAGRIGATQADGKLPTLPSRRRNGRRPSACRRARSVGRPSYGRAPSRAGCARRHGRAGVPGPVHVGLVITVGRSRR